MWVETTMTNDQWSTFDGSILGLSAVDIREGAGRVWFYDLLMEGLI